MKQCRYCKKYYSELDFGVAKTTSSKVYRRHKCRYCYRKTKNVLKDKRRSWIAEFKKEKGCEKCGIDDPRVLDFHHTGDKEFALADYYYHQFSFEKAKEEMSKCIVLCANCHRILHYEERNSTLV